MQGPCRVWQRSNKLLVGTYTHRYLHHRVRDSLYFLYLNFTLFFAKKKLCTLHHGQRSSTCPLLPFLLRSAVQWRYIGCDPATPTSILPNQVTNPVLGFPKGVPFIVSSGTTNGPTNAVVFTNNAWGYAGAPDFSGVPAGYLSATFPANDGPYASFADETANPSPTPPVVMKYTAATNSWATFVPAVPVATVPENYIAMAGNGMLYFVYRDSTTSPNDALTAYSIDTTNLPTATWTMLGTNGAASGVFTTSGTSVLLTHPITNAPYVAYLDYCNNVPGVRTWDGSSWVEIGAGQVTDYPALYGSIGFAISDAGDLYQAFNANSDSKIFTYKYPAGGTSWTSMATAFDVVPNTQNQLGVALALDKNGVPNLLGCDNNSAFTSFAYDGTSAWVQYGASAFETPASLVDFSFAFDPDSTPSLAVAALNQQYLMFMQYT